MDIDGLVIDSIGDDAAQGFRTVAALRRLADRIEAEQVVSAGVRGGRGRR